MDTTQELIERIQAGLSFWQQDIVKKKMFGGTCFLFKGKMSIGEVKGQLVVRVVASKMEHTLAQEFVSPMTFTGKPMKEFVYVSPEGYHTNEQLQSWIELGIEHATYASQK